MSNYPLGVTGQEWQISGSPEWQGHQEVECLMDVITSDGTEGECEFSGNVEGDYVGDKYSEATFYWTCPSCNRDHDTDVSFTEKDWYTD